MRHASSLTSKWMSVLSILAVFTFANLSAAQASSKKKLSKTTLPQATSHSTARSSKIPPPATTDTWTGGGGSSNTNWSDASNWNNGAITSGENIAISTTTANTVDDQSFTIGTLTLSNSGDSVSLNNNVQTTVEGTISNNGTITINAAGNTTGLYLNNSLTLSGTGVINLTTTNGTQYTGFLYGVSGSVLTTSSTIEGAGTVGNGELNFVNSGTINANISGQGLLLNPDTCSTCTNSNTGTIEASGGGILNMSAGGWSQSGGGKILAANGSTVNLSSGVSITGGTLTTTGTGTINDAVNQDIFLTNVTNSGNYIVQNNAATEVSGTITNNGTITLNAAGNTTEIYLTGATTLAGSGTINLTSSGNEYTGVINGVGGSALTNQTTIEGWGTVGNGNLQITNASNGIINSNVSGGDIFLNPDTSLTNTNAGLLEATNGGTLTMSGGAWTNSGTIEAQAGSSINLQSSVSITGGTLEAVGSGSSINALANQDVFLTNVTLSGTFNVQNNAATEINGTITNNGVINLNSTGNTTQLYVTNANSATATLTGSGSIVLGTGAANNEITGASGTSLTIAQNVSGVGNIGAGVLTLTNSSTIDANISPTVSTTALTIQPGSGGMTNTGTMEATNGGTLQLYSNAINNTGGTIEAVGADSKNNASTVVLADGVSITGGTLTTSGAGVIEVATNQIANVTTLTNKGALNVLNNGELETNGTITNNGTISLIGTGNSTYLYAPTNTTLNGTGSVILTSSNNDYTGVIDSASGVTLTNNETISGWGTVENGTFVNNGTVNSNQSGGNIVMQGFAAATNTKTMEATNGGTLTLYGSSWTNTGGTISAAAGSAVDLTDNVTITGGTLTTTGTGQFYVQSNNNVNLSTLTNSGTLNVLNNGELNTNGTITNNGTISLIGTGNSTYLYAPTNTTLAGTGSIILTSTNSDYTGVIETASSATLTNGETISGWGTIENGTFVNNGTVNANQSGGLIMVQNLTGTNTKTMEATNGATLELYGSTWTQTGLGTITAQTGSSVELTNNTSITGGTLSTVGTGQFFAASNNVVYLANLTNSGTFNIDNNAQTELTGTITNNGSFNITSTGNDTYLLINGPVTLKGTGTITLGGSCNTCDILYGEGTAPALTSSNTIQGAGFIGDGNMAFTNSGTVDANVAGANLTLDLNSTGLTNYNGTTTTLTGGSYISNGGNLVYNFGSATGITTLSASVTEEGGGQFLNSFNNSNTNALANLTSITSTGAFTTDVNFADAGAFSNAGSLTILAGTTFKVQSLSQISSGSLTAGTYVLDSNLDITGAAQTITTNAANLTLAGGTIENTSNSTNALASLATNTGKLTLGSGTAFTTSASSFSNTGTLTLAAGSTFTAPALAQISGTTLSGGTFVLGGNLDLNSGVSITTNSSTLTLEGTGTIKSGSANALAGLATNTKSLTLADDANFTTTGNFSNTGTLTVDSGSTFKVTSALSQYHSTTNTLQGGTFVVGGNLDAALGANGIETDSSNITLDGTGEIVNTSASNANGLLNLNTISSTGAFTLASDANFTTAGNLTNSGKLTVNAGSTLTVTGSLTNLATGTLTGGTYTIGGTLQLTSANGGIQTNDATLTLTGASAKILDGTSNALSTFNNNDGSLTLSSAATLTTATSASFNNSGTVDLAKGTALTVGGTNNAYDQTSGTTTVDGTLTVAGGLSLTGGTIQGAGTIKANTSNDATINVGDAGKAGLLTITGTYTQLSSATLNVSIGGATADTQYSQLKISGTASLGGTLTAALVNSFTPTVGQTFTILTASSVSGTFTNSTIAINSSEHFVVSYTSTSVVLTVVSGAASSNNPPQAAAQVAVAKPASKITQPIAITTARHIGTVVGRPILIASGKPTSPVGTVAQRIWERVPVAPSWEHGIATGVGRGPLTLGGVIGAPARHINNVNDGLSHALPVRAPLGTIETKRIPVKILTPTLPRMR